MEAMNMTKSKPVTQFSCKQLLDFFPHHEVNQAHLNEVERRTAVLASLQNKQSFSGDKSEEFYQISKHGKTCKPADANPNQLGRADVFIVFHEDYSEGVINGIIQSLHYLQHKIYLKNSQQSIWAMFDYIKRKEIQLNQDSTIGIGKHFTGSFQTNTNYQFGKQSTSIAIWGPLAKLIPELAMEIANYIQTDASIVFDVKENAIQLIEKTV